MLRELRNNPNLTQPQLTSIMGLGKSAIQNNISFLKKNGLLEQIKEDIGESKNNRG
ncbi:helix-turn-helix domain-containing protein [[Clostridium] aminophilum]|uniref:MarR family transcriptional regulator n=1 Tax=[Clostridium] aminophilum TaxID=1526 RepID=UPI0033257BB5